MSDCAHEWEQCWFEIEDHEAKLVGPFRCRHCRILREDECRGCGTVKGQCDDWKQQRGAVCCPDCSHGKAGGGVAAVLPQFFGLLKLARSGAFLEHDWYFDAAENIDGVPPNGHEQPFETCPHPDCALVREGASPRPPSPAEEGT